MEPSNPGFDLGGSDFFLGGKEVEIWVILCCIIEHFWKNRGNLIKISEFLEYSIRFISVNISLNPNPLYEFDRWNRSFQLILISPLAAFSNLRKINMRLEICLIHRSNQCFPPQIIITGECIGIFLSNLNAQRWKNFPR